MFTEVNRFRLFQRVRNIYPVHFVHVRPLLRYRSDRLLCWAGTKRSCNQSVGPTSLLRWKRGKKLHLHQLLIFQFYRSTFTTVHQPCFQLPPTMKNCSSWKGWEAASSKNTMCVCMCLVWSWYLDVLHQSSTANSENMNNQRRYGKWIVIRKWFANVWHWEWHVNKIAGSLNQDIEIQLHQSKDRPWFMWLGGILKVYWLR